MVIYYSYILLLLFLLLITHWTNAASLHLSENEFIDHRNSSNINSQYSIIKPILFEQYSQLPLIKRLKRWIKNEDHDEVEIPIDETTLSYLNNTIIEPTVPVNNSDDIFSLNSILNSTLLNFEIIELNSSIIENSDNLINSTWSSQLNMTTFQIDLNENTTINSIITEIKYPLLRQDLTDLNQTTEQSTISIIEEILENNKTDINRNNDNLTINNIIFSSTDSEIFLINITSEINESITDSIDNLTKEFESSSIPLILNKTIEELTNTDNNQTNGWSLLFNNNHTETILLNDVSTITIDNELSTNIIINSNISLKNTIIINHDIDMITAQNDTTINMTATSDVIQNDTGRIILETNPNINDTFILPSKSIIIPICDRSCQCTKECPYGFEILNNTCLCDPPCKNYQCFGDDICVITDKGQPLCQPNNNTEYDRPIRCYQPRDAGYHDINIRYHNRWYYNPDQDTCHLFVYRGLGGNENNFQTLNECHLECITCAPLPDPGTCLGRINMWYYDYKKSECSQFEYSGCKGNENKFLRKEQCIDICINRILNLK